LWKGPDAVAPGARESGPAERIVRGTAALPPPAGTHVIGWFSRLEAHESPSQGRSIRRPRKWKFGHAQGLSSGLQHAGLGRTRAVVGSFLSKPAIFEAVPDGPVTKPKSRRVDEALLALFDRSVRFACVLHRKAPIDVWTSCKQAVTRLMDLAPRSAAFGFGVQRRGRRLGIFSRHQRRVGNQGWVSVRRPSACGRPFRGPSPAAPLQRHRLRFAEVGAPGRVGEANGCACRCFGLLSALDRAPKVEHPTRRSYSRRCSRAAGPKNGAVAARLFARASPTDGQP